MRRSWMPWLLPCALLAGCGSGSGPGAEGAVVTVADTPAHAGELWTLAEAQLSDAPSPADLAAFVEGLHVFVLDGDKVYAGSLRHDGKRQPDGSLQFALPGGRQARLSPDGDGMALHLGEGEPARLVRQADPAGGAP